MQELSAAVQAHINSLCAEYSELLDCHEVLVREADQRIIVSCHCAMDGNLPITKIHDVTEALQDRVKEKFPQIFGLATGQDNDPVFVDPGSSRESEDFHPIQAGHLHIDQQEISALDKATALLRGLIVRVGRVLVDPVVVQEGLYGTGRIGTARGLDA